VSFERKAPSVWFAAAIFAAATAGCALEGAEPTAESTSSTPADLQAAGDVRAVPFAAQRVAVPEPAAFAPARPAAAKPITLVPLESPKTPIYGGDTDDDPRPHPWEPPPGDNTQQGTQGADPASGGTGSTK
jgi:hypothetical protein